MSRQRVDVDADARRDASVSNRIMGFMKRFTRKKSPKNKDFVRPRNNDYYSPQSYHGPDHFSRLDDKLLLRIFEHICPHATDDSLDSSEDSGNDGCMSCDTRDLAHCALVKRQWYGVSAGLLYKSVRIDAVHYCELEEVYAEQRRRKSRNGDDMDAPTLRLLQLCRTVRDNHYVGSRVRFLKLPYMTRESCKAEIARTVSVCPNIEFVDLPDGFFNGDVTCHTLRQEMQARCAHIRKMKYNEGGEQSLESLMHGYWQELRVIELNRIQMEPTILRRVFGILPWLSEISFADLPWLDDSIFHPASGLPDFPALDTLKLRKINRITAHGLAQYLSSPVCSNALRTLTIKDCVGLPVQELHLVLGAAMALETLEYTATVSAALPLDPYPPMLSYSLRKMNFEIISNGSNQMYPPGASYYQYLTKSLMSSSLPALRKLYVRDPTFPESLVLAPPIRPFADSPAHTPRGFSQPLEVFSKGLDELEWIFTSIIPADVHGRRGSMSGGRPLSSYSAHKGLGPQWGGDARKSVVVPNGFGGFLAIPADGERPRSAGHISPSFPSHGHSQSMGHISNGNNVRASFMSHAGRDKRASRADLWR